jgi:hypothetical protein
MTKKKKKRLTKKMREKDLKGMKMISLYLLKIKMRKELVLVGV